MPVITLQKSNFTLNKSEGQDSPGRTAAYPNYNLTNFFHGEVYRSTVPLQPVLKGMRVFDGNYAESAQFAALNTLITTIPAPNMCQYCFKELKHVQNRRSNLRRHSEDACLNEQYPSTSPRMTSARAYTREQKWPNILGPLVDFYVYIWKKMKAQPSIFQ